MEPKTKVIMDVSASLHTYLGQGQKKFVDQHGLSLRKVVGFLSCNTWGGPVQNAGYQMVSRVT
uniref:Uncharacterized protein n=1 Tax=Arundo donax TaxID=35708 RepID=A0A0A8YTT8_ARUDO